MKKNIQRHTWEREQGELGAQTKILVAVHRLMVSIRREPAALLSNTRHRPGTFDYWQRKLKNESTEKPRVYPLVLSERILKA
jgi:hypothetical protein